MRLYLMALADVLSDHCTCLLPATPFRDLQMAYPISKMGWVVGLHLTPGLSWLALQTYLREDRHMVGLAAYIVYNVHSRLYDHISLLHRNIVGKPFVEKLNILTFSCPYCWFNHIRPRGIVRLYVKWVVVPEFSGTSRRNSEFLSLFSPTGMLDDSAMHMYY